MKLQHCNFFIHRLTVISLLCFALTAGCSISQSKTTNKGENINKLTKTEKKEGWKLLFDGLTLSGWRGLGRETIPDNWIVEDGLIRNINRKEIMEKITGSKPQLGDLMTVDKYENYELYFEWKIKEAGNTGLKYNVSEEMSKRYAGFSALGFEYQLIDDHAPRYKNLKPSQFSGSLYDLIPAQNISLKPIGEFNSSRILLNGNHGEHWLNGIKVLEYEIGSASLEALYKQSKFVKYPEFLTKKNGHIVLQNHQDDAWFRNIKIREIK